MKTFFRAAAFAAAILFAGFIAAQTPDPKMVSIWGTVYADTLNPIDLTELVLYDSTYDRFALPGLHRGEFKIQKLSDRLELNGIPVPINSGWDYADPKRIAEFFNLFGDAAYQQGYKDTVPAIDSIWLANQKGFWTQRLTKGGFAPKRTIFVVFFGESNQCMAMRLSANEAVPPAFKFFEWPVNMTLSDLKTNGTINEKAYVALTATGATDLVGLWKLGWTATPEKHRKKAYQLFQRYHFDAEDWLQR